MGTNEQIFDTRKTKEMIAKGRRARWLLRKGGKSSGFKYFDCDGKLVTNDETLERIKNLVIPPAWKHVRICPSPSGRLQVVGMDGKGRIQYRYHPAYERKMQRKKFAKVEEFGEYLPVLREQTSRDLSLDGLPKEKVLAIVLRLINSLYFRVGTDLSAKHYKTYGITTLHKKHLTIKPKGRLEFEYVGKSHVEHRKVLVEEELAEIVRRIARLPRGRKLFRYVAEDGKMKPITPAMVNAYLKSITDERFSSKDLRTWGGTLLTAVELAEIGPADSDADTKKKIVKVVKKVAEELGNTPAVCRGSYIHPVVLDAYANGITLNEFQANKKRRIKRVQRGLEPEEAALLKLFQNGNGSS
jgi:DNA topoisomerase-1